ncbi:hypothetical protein DHEL01_v204951 [Diaporthe helianthi]|uniref:Uncharacterized protein n=1 Tax=Diaporthe helianthi TaxID=158607 RepID=A0A2P5I2D1_DIAHE|nr:hypothetical protein DHEL01_v204951 [Diaporthe helianthi]
MPLHIYPDFNVGHSTSLNDNTNTSSYSCGVNNIPPESETTDRGCKNPTAEILGSSTPPASNALQPQPNSAVPLMPTSKMARSSAPLSGTPHAALHASSQKIVLPPGGEPSSSDSQHGSDRLSLPRSPSPAAAKLIKSLTPPSVSQTRRPPTPASSPVRETSMESTLAEPKSASKSARSLDTYDRSIIAATATLAYLQSQYGEEDSPSGYKNNSCATKVRQLTKIAIGLLQFPGEAIAISAEVLQNSIHLTVAHDPGNSTQSPLGMEQIEGPEKYVLIMLHHLQEF